MNRKKVAVALGAVVSIPFVFLLGFLLGDRFYMRLIYAGEVEDFAPGMR